MRVKDSRFPYLASIIILQPGLLGGPNQLASEDTLVLCSVLIPYAVLYANHADAGYI